MTKKALCEALRDGWDKVEVRLLRGYGPNANRQRRAVVFTRGTKQIWLPVFLPQIRRANAGWVTWLQEDARQAMERIERKQAVTAVA